ncbi:MAG: hypothetical protein JWQ97_3966 [Phenylobacterium sp.]|nr:hypothetical protein [Phenylobacterium sp.]
MTIRLGDAELLRVEEMTDQMHIKKLTRDVGFAREAAAAWGPAYFDDASQTFTLVYQAWILRLNGLTVVIDPCSGNDRKRPLVPHLQDLQTPFLERFEASGVRCEDVDVVFCTHLHCDHCGWNTKLKGGRFVPTFPNARYVFVRREFEHWDPSRPDHVFTEWNEGVFEDSVRPVVDAGLAELVAEDAQIAPGIFVEPTHGHTAGHSALRFASGGREGWFTGDVFNHPLQILDARLEMAGHEDPAASEATRRRVRARLAQSEALLAPAHFAPGYVTRVGERYGFRPLVAEPVATPA